MTRIYAARPPMPWAATQTRNFSGCEANFISGTPTSHMINAEAMPAIAIALMPRAFCCDPVSFFLSFLMFAQYLWFFRETSTKYMVCRRAWLDTRTTHVKLFSYHRQLALSVTFPL